MRLNETVETRDKAAFLTTIVHDEWLETVISGREENYQDWAEFAAWLVLKCVLEQRDGMAV